MVKGIPIIDFQHNPCEGCILAKTQIDSFQHASTYWSKVHLELVLTDLCGPMQN